MKKNSVSTLLSGNILESGMHSLSLESSKLSKGIYVCVLEINGKLYSRKFLKQ